MNISSVRIWGFEVIERGRDVDKTLARCIVALALLTIAIAAWMGRSQFSPREKRFSTGFTNQVLAMELVRANSEVQEIVGEVGDPNRDIMRGKVQKDFLFIPAYALLFVALGWLLRRSNYRLAIWVGTTIVVCAAGAAVFDFVENIRILRVLDTHLPDTTLAMLEGLRQASLAKWALVFIAMTLLAPIVFLRREVFTLPFGPRWLTAVFGAVIALHYLITGLVGLIGLNQNLLIERALTFMSLALLLTVLLLLPISLTRGRLRAPH